MQHTARSHPPNPDRQQHLQPKPKRQRQKGRRAVTCRQRSRGTDAGACAPSLPVGDCHRCVWCSILARGLECWRLPRPPLCKHSSKTHEWLFNKVEFPLAHLLLFAVIDVERRPHVPSSLLQRERAVLLRTQ
jgi:hypothetical protein